MILHRKSITQFCKIDEYDRKIVEEIENSRKKESKNKINKINKQKQAWFLVQPSKLSLLSPSQWDQDDLHRRLSPPIQIYK